LLIHHHHTTVATLSLHCRYTVATLSLLFPLVSSACSSLRHSRLSLFESVKRPKCAQSRNSSMPPFAT
jgi:hypothetical protein